MLTRVHVERVLEGWDDEVTYRICEADGKLCDCWLPGVENPDPEGPLDRGGFDLASDAASFALGVDRERALFGLLTESVEEIDAERAKLDGANRIKRYDDDAQLDLGALLDAVAAPEVMRRRVGLSTLLVTR